MALKSTSPGAIQQQNSPTSNDSTSRILYDVWVHRFGSHLEQKNAHDEESTLPSHGSSVSSLGTFLPFLSFQLTGTIRSCGVSFDLKAMTI